MSRRLIAGRAMMIAAGIIYVLLLVINLANIEEPAPWTWTGLFIVAGILLVVGASVAFLGKEEKEVKEAVERVGGTVGKSRNAVTCPPKIPFFHP